VKTFSHWRAVGRAMLDARRREGVTAPRTAVDNGDHESTGLGLTWKRADGLTVELWWLRIGSNVDVAVKYPHEWTESRPYGQFVGVDNASNAATVLRVLAALELIRADIAYAADERYGRCVKCGRLAQWWPAEACSPARWVHVYDDDERFVDYANHQPVVPE
jgi:hypothetical protein